MNITSPLEKTRSRLEKPGIVIMNWNVFSHANRSHKYIWVSRDFECFKVKPRKTLRVFDVRNEKCLLGTKQPWIDNFHINGQHEVSARDG